jgi:hypothetical protein
LRNVHNREVKRFGAARLWMRSRQSVRRPFGPERRFSAGFIQKVESKGID